MKFEHLILSVSAFIFLSFGLPKNIQKKVDKEISSTFEVEAFSFEEKIIAVVNKIRCLKFILRSYSNFSLLLVNKTPKLKYNF